MKKIILFISVVMFCAFHSNSQSIIINHNCTKIEQIPESAILAAKQNLHIAYGHTSHGSQLIDGMTGLVAFMNSNGFTNNLYTWDNGGTNGALDLHDYAMGGDVGYYPDWVNNTRSYLGTPDAITGRGTGSNADVNVIIWSWCGQVDDKYAAGTLVSEYIDPMVQLESDYFGIKFIYMTGHLDHSDDANNKAANNQIRNFCSANNKILYDFNDIECYNPDGDYFEFAGDDCNYYASATGLLIGNWATDWQNSHTENVDWYNCGSAHSQPLNANQKAYAAWWLWARLAGWSPTADLKNANNESVLSIFPNPSSDYIQISNLNKTEDFKIYSVMGKKITEGQIANQEKIDIINLPKGIYLIKVGDFYPSKFIKQ